jgi:cysteine synthase A
MPVAGSKAIHYSQQLARQEGIFTGITGGATLAGTISIAEQAEAGSTLLCMLPDTGERYLTTPLFDGIDSEMNSEEVKISASTPNYQFGTAGG